MPFLIVPLTIASVAAWLVGNGNRRSPPPASWTPARGSVRFGDFIVLHDPLRPAVLRYQIGDTVGLALRGPYNSVVRGTGTIVDKGEYGGVTVRWETPLATLSGRGLSPAPGSILQSGPEGVAWVFPHTGTGVPETLDGFSAFDDRLPEISPTVLDAAAAVLTGARARALAEAAPTLTAVAAPTTIDRVEVAATQSPPALTVEPSPTPIERIKDEGTTFDQDEDPAPTAANEPAVTKKSAVKDVVDESAALVTSAGVVGNA